MSLAVFHLKIQLKNEVERDAAEEFGSEPPDPVVWPAILICLATRSSPQSQARDGSMPQYGCHCTLWSYNP